MDTALIVITLVSVGLTGALLIYASRLHREQTDREEARVVALAHDIRVDGAAPAMEMGPNHGTQSLFSGGPAPAGSIRRLAIPFIGAAVVGVAVGLVYFVSARAAGASRPAAEAASTASASASLELVALGQSRSRQALTVHGVVRNPAGAAPRRGITAVIFVFDRSGAFVTSARAAIDYQVLEGGDESPFTVAVPMAIGAARYRVSFRTEADVLPHLDVRTGPKGPGAHGVKIAASPRAPSP